MADAMNRGPRSTYEIIWRTGHIERLEAHQVSYPERAANLFAPADATGAPERIEFHGEFDGRWQLVLSAVMEDIHVIRNLTHCAEHIGEDG